MKSFRLQVIVNVMIVDPDNPLAVEIRQEMTDAYFAACKKMVAALEALRIFDCAVALSIRNSEQIARRAELFGDAAERVFFVVIQREAMNLPCHAEFFEDYEIPDEVKKRLGPRRGE